MGTRKRKVYLIINNKQQRNDFLVMDTFKEDKIDETVKRQKGDIYIDIKNGNVDKIIEFAKEKKYQVINYGKTYILNKCFTGTRYALFGKNISHEAINKFQADNGGRYFFLCRTGSVDVEDLLEQHFIAVNGQTVNYFDVQNANLISFSEYESGSNKQYAFIQKVNKIELYNKNEELVFNGVPIKSIFGGNGYSDKTGFEKDRIVKEVDLVLTDITFKGEEIEEPKNINEKDLFGMTTIGFEKLTKHERQFVFEGTKFYKVIEGHLKNIAWKKDEPYSYTNNYMEEDSVFSIIGKGDRETYFSSLISYAFEQAPLLLKGFLGRDIGEYEIFREEKNVDILIRGENEIVVLENKINAHINDGEKKSWCDLITDKDKDENIIQLVEQSLASNKKESQLQKYYKLALYYAFKQGLSADDVKCYILCPEYKREFYETEKTRHIAGDLYKVKTYKELYEIISEDKLLNLLKDKVEIIHDLKRAIKPYISKKNTYYIDRICGRFINKIKSLMKNA